MKHRNSHLLVGYWSRLRRGRDVPDQTEIDPRAIKRMLSQVCILEASDPPRAMFRLAGTWLCDRFGFELKGTSFLGTWDVPSRNQIVLLMKQSLAMKQPVCISSIGSTADCAMVELETILAPLSFGEGGPTRFLGMVHFLGDTSAIAGRTITSQRLVGSKMIHEDEPVDSLPTPPAPPAEPVRNHPKAPHLRLVVSRNRAATVHSEMDEMMRELLTALEIKRGPRLSLLGR
jgi:hypothetical protein